MRYAAKAAAEYIAAAEFARVSDAVTVWVPLVSGGGVNAQELKLPRASALQDLETGLPSTRKVMVLFGAKPRPLTAMRGPLVPTLGVRLMLGLVACAYRPVAAELEACTPGGRGANPMTSRAHSNDRVDKRVSKTVDGGMLLPPTFPNLSD